MKQELYQIWQNIRMRGRHPFMVTAQNNVSYRNLYYSIKDICGLFDDNGLKPGVKITIAVSDDATASAIFLAAFFDGLVPIMLSPENSPEKMVEISRSLDSKLHFDDNTEIIPRHLRVLKRFRVSHKYARTPLLPEVEYSKLCYILFTSGSTATPRGVEITYGNLFTQITTMQRLFLIGPGSRICNSSPISHTDGLVQGPIISAVLGACVLRPGSFKISELDQWLDFLRAECPTHIITNPTILSFILKFSPNSDAFASSQLKALICTGGALPESLWTAFQTNFNVKVFNVYGSTETVANALFAGAHPEMGELGSIGKPVDCQARVAKGAQSGELELKGNNISPRYWADPNLTAETRTSDGWFRTGDMVIELKSGSYQFLGRFSSVINQGAVRIFPDEIDEVIKAHPSVVECVTFALPDQDFEEIAVCAVTTASELDVEELYTATAESLPSLKKPKIIKIVEQIPKTSTGKIDRGVLVEWFNNQQSSEVHVAYKNVVEKVFRIMSEVFSVSVSVLSVTSADKETLGWDSFNHLKLILAIEEEFSIELSTNDIIRIRNTDDLVQTVQSHLDAT